MFEGAGPDTRKYVVGYKKKLKDVEKFEWIMVGITPSGKADWRYIAKVEVKEVEVPIMKTAFTMHRDKTKRDHSRGVHDNRFKNRTLRQEWDGKIGAKGAGRTAFPIQVCNGKRSRAIKKSNGPQKYMN